MTLGPQFEPPQRMIPDGRYADGVHVRDLDVMTPMKSGRMPAEPPSLSPRLPGPSARSPQHDLTSLMRRPTTFRDRSEGYMEAPNGGMYINGSGYDADEVAMYTRIAAGGVQKIQNELGYDLEEAEDHHKRWGQPLQGMLFDPTGIGESHEERRAAAQHHSVMLKRPGQDATEDEYQSLTVKAQMMKSRMPADLIRGLAGETTVLADPNFGTKRFDGWYSPKPGGPVTVRLNPDKPIPSQETLIHELGHRADFRSHGDDSDANIDYIDDVVAVPITTYPNPRLEGIADGFTDRYLGVQFDDMTDDVFRHITRTGYSTAYSGPVNVFDRWNDRDRAIYAASRAHFSETGENPTAGSPSEYLHMMLRTSPHARRALMENNQAVSWPEGSHGSLWGEAKRSSDEYLASRKVGTQLSMLKELVAITDSTPTEDRPTFREHTLGFVPTEGEYQAPSFNPPEGHLMVHWRDSDLSHPVYDDPYAGHLSSEQHSKIMADEMDALEKQRKERYAKRLAEYGY